ncbi:MAG TPA: hypothetical protein VG796_03065 [Verrucomicrobiales bacterium]|nr:hypothetical protein [Verrucomicrobiales bacterium]
MPLDSAEVLHLAQDEGTGCARLIERFDKAPLRMRHAARRHDHRTGALPAFPDKRGTGRLTAFRLSFAG